MFPDSIRQKAQDYLNKNKAPKADSKPSYEAMPNADKLTPSEKWIYKKLPGFTESTIGKALARFNETWAGKALQYLDVAAEGLERTVGLTAQLTDPNYN